MIGVMPGVRIGGAGSGNLAVVHVDRLSDARNRPVELRDWLAIQKRRRQIGADHNDGDEGGEHLHAASIIGSRCSRDSLSTLHLVESGGSRSLVPPSTPHPASSRSLPAVDAPARPS